MDFSATPYNDVGSGRNKRKVFFSHIMVDFDLKSAMRAGLVKSLVLDNRKEIGAIANQTLEFKAERDEDGNLCLSEGQRVMLRAGLAKLRKLERDFAALDAAQRSGREWGYVLLGEAAFYEWRDKGGRMAEMLEFARVRSLNNSSAQQKLAI